MFDEKVDLNRDLVVIIYDPSDENSFEEVKNTYINKSQNCKNKILLAACGVDAACNDEDCLKVGRQFASEEKMFFKVMKLNDKEKEQGKKFFGEVEKCIEWYNQLTIDHESD